MSDQSTLEQIQIAEEEAKQLKANTLEITQQEKHKFMAAKEAELKNISKESLKDEISILVSEAEKTISNLNTNAKSEIKKINELSVSQDQTKQVKDLISNKLA